MTAPKLVKEETPGGLEGHALEIYLALLGQQRFGSDARSAAREALRLAAIFTEAVECAAAGNPVVPAPTDPYAELDLGYAPNFSETFHINRMSRYMPRPGGKRGEMIERPDLDAALADCRKARAMSAEERSADLVHHMAQKEADDKKRFAAIAEEQRKSAAKRMYEAAMGTGT